MCSLWSSHSKNTLCPHTYASQCLHVRDQHPQCTWANLHTRVCTHTGINAYTHTQMPAVWHGADDLIFYSPLLNTSSCSYQFPGSSAWSMESSRVSQGAGMWSCAGVQRDTDTKVLHIHLIEPAVYLFISGKQVWALQASESHSEGPRLLFFFVRNKC